MGTGSPHSLPEAATKAVEDSTLSPPGARTKEIGIRKVNDASTFQILLLLNRDFIIMVIMALAIGIPVTFLLVRSWLQNFVYRIDILWWVFAIASFGFLVISILTVTYQSWRAASQDPVKSLRYE